MGQVRMVNSSELNEASNVDTWWSDYDTIYYAHENDNQDEFYIRDTAKILKWFILVHDDRLCRLGLDKEFDEGDNCFKDIC